MTLAPLLTDDVPARTFTLGGWVAEDYNPALAAAMPAIVEQAVHAFYAAVARGVDEAIGGRTSGDLMPDELATVEDVLTRLAVSFATNNEHTLVVDEPSDPVPS